MQLLYHELHLGLSPTHDHRVDAANLAAHRQRASDSQHGYPE
jgi:hypothetical protein